MSGIYSHFFSRTIAVSTIIQWTLEKCFAQPSEIAGLSMKADCMTPEGMISTEPDNTEYSYQKRVVERNLQFCDQDDRGVEGRVCLKGPMIFSGSGKFSASYRIFLK